jgi:hypothetical protein
VSDELFPVDDEGYSAIENGTGISLTPSTAQRPPRHSSVL